MKHILIFKNETVTLSKDPNKEDYWLYDKTRGCNLAMRAKTEQEAFIQTITYYQKRLIEVEKEFNSLKDKVDSFVESFTVPCDCRF